MEYSDNERLLPCPFCGSKAWLQNVVYDDGDVWYNPQCSGCNCGWAINYGTEEEAINGWNDRNANS